ncbi:hypothetical protein [Pseudoalteromonas luteoviolacea]|uniref:Uncharacterized protein n=3 Tax=Pseudoalteromonas TaxID=53246 RepID=V4HBK4_PSEL2|nr:hypothetical protein [Pseudoalteromonas luteoviolacea]ESP94831.1 hypothetical protein PL2TA16_00019 [Pseudoalteromonas luteoviolacea 2ta16]KZN42785.1 hypothetical protein N483_10440 [Pseudoalteromonas luteoviolacea NCIMB 1944]
MKMQINKKHLKTLSQDKQLLPNENTPHVAGGTGSWPTPATTTVRQRTCPTGDACKTNQGIYCVTR